MVPDIETSFVNDDSKAINNETQSKAGKSRKKDKDAQSMTGASKKRNQKAK